MRGAPRPVPPHVAANPNTTQGSGSAAPFYRQKSGVLGLAVPERAPWAMHRLRSRPSVPQPEEETDGQRRTGPVHFHSALPRA